MLFPVDHGNSSIKTVNFVFSSGLADYPIRPPVDTDILEYGGKYWTLSGKRISYMRDKTKDDRYFILTLFAIAKELQKSDTMSPMVETDLAVGLPPEHYALRQRFAEYFKRGTVNFVFNGTPVCLVIRHVLVYPQAYAAVVPQAARLKEIPRTFIIDIGGFTTDVMLLRNSVPDMQFCRSLEMGVIHMSNDIIGRVNAMYDMKIEDDHIVDIILADDQLTAAFVANPFDFGRIVFHMVGGLAFGTNAPAFHAMLDLRIADLDGQRTVDLRKAAQCLGLSQRAGEAVQDVTVFAVVLL